METLKYLVALNHFSKFGPVRLNKLQKSFANWREAFFASPEKLIKAGIENNIAQEFVQTRKNIIPDKILEQLKQNNIKVISLQNKSYPKLLKEIYNPPIILYYYGEFIPEKDEFSIGIVGSRKYSIYGKQVVEKFSFELAQNNLNIVSGLALGIDTLAHNACLKAQGRTIAVLGCGLDLIYPASNKRLAQQIIASGGAIISEFPLGTPPLKHNFPQRNRIIAGLSLGVLVVEATKKSGALITANYALESNREVFAIPGNIFSPNSKGTNQLIKKGALAVTGTKDIINDLDLKQVNHYIDNKILVPKNEEEKIILTYLSHEPTHIDKLIRDTKLNASLVSSTLAIMEMKGMVKNLGGMRYVKS